MLVCEFPVRIYRNTGMGRAQTIQNLSMLFVKATHAHTHDAVRLSTLVYEKREKDEEAIHVRVNESQIGRFLMLRREMNLHKMVQCPLPVNVRESNESGWAVFDLRPGYTNNIKAF